MEPEVQLFFKKKNIVLLGSVHYPIHRQAHYKKIDASSKLISINLYKYGMVFMLPSDILLKYLLQQTDHNCRKADSFKHKPMY